jgi:hypothetical protein
MSLILRCVNILKNSIKVEEYFVEFIILDDFTGECLFNVFIDVIKKLELNINDIRGHKYDNRSNMKGKERVVQKRLLNINSKAFYTLILCYVVLLIHVLKLYLFLELYSVYILCSLHLQKKKMENITR